jgi:hypothetical protein
MSQHEPAQLVGIEGLIYLIRGQKVMLDKVVIEAKASEYFGFWSYLPHLLRE